MIDSALLTPFGRLIRSARLQRDLTLKDACQAMGMNTLQRLYEYEMGLKIPGRRRGLMMAEFYGIPLQEFFDKMEEGS